MRRIGEQRAAPPTVRGRWGPARFPPGGTSTNTLQRCIDLSTQSGTGRALSDQLTAFDGQRRALRIIVLIRISSDAASITSDSLAVNDSISMSVRACSASSA